MVTVTTKEELEKAKDNNEPEITVVGELATKLIKTKKIATLGSVGITALVGAIGLATIAAPETLGLSYLALAPVAALTGMEVVAIIAVASLGLGLILSLFKGYEMVEIDSGQVKFKAKKSSDSQ
jgi:hypothetical protein